MAVATKVKLEARLHDLIGYIKQGRILDAMQEFYAKDVTMQENANPPTVGLDQNIERERQFLQGVKEWKGSDFRAVAIGDDVTFYEGTFDFVATDGTPVHLEQVAVAHWRDGKIIHERFYYDAGGGSTP